jgi:hypothetical protein
MEIDMETATSSKHKMTEELRFKILKLWRDGVSGGEISKLLGVTRNSVIGVSYRARKNGLLSSIKPKKEKAIKVPKRAIKKEELKIEPIVEEPIIIEEDQTCDMDGLNYYSCRYIVSGDTYDTVRYCGKHIHTSSYCLHHYKICYHPPKMSAKDLWRDGTK